MESIFYKSGYAYQLCSPFSVKTDVMPPEDIDTEYIKLSADGLLSLKEGYAWDGATGIPDTREILRASLVHDALYQLMRGDFLNEAIWRERADNALRSICIEDGVAHAFAELAYQAVRLLGNPSADPSIEHPILEAPRDI